MIEKSFNINVSLSNYGYIMGFKFHQRKMSVEGWGYLKFTKKCKSLYISSHENKKVLSPFHHKKIILIKSKCVRPAMDVSHSFSIKNIFFW